MVTQEELINKAVKETLNLLHMPCGLDVLATEAIKTYIKLKNMEDVNTEVNESDIEKVVQEEYTESKHDCENDTTIKPQSKLDIHPNSPHLDYIKHMADNIPQDEWASTLKSEDVDEWAKTQKVDIFGDIHTHPEINDPIIKHLCNVYGASNWYEAFANKTNAEIDDENKRIFQKIKDKEKDSECTNEGLNRGSDDDLVSSHATTPTTPTPHTTHSSHMHNSSKGHLLKVTKREPHRINHLVQQHNMKVVDNMYWSNNNDVIIVECDIIWNDEQWNDDNIVPYIVAISERDLDPVTDTNVGFRLTSPADMKNYLKYDSKNDFTIVRINNHYQL